jgi:plasmid stabilization system protein ParE
LNLLNFAPFLGGQARSPDLARKGYRCFIIGDYIIYYKMRGVSVDAYRVVHGARRLKGL